MSARGSVSGWIERWRLGRDSAAALLWQRYHRRLWQVARRRLKDAPRGAADEDDVVAESFECFFRRAREGGFDRLCDRDDLWRILVTIVRRKADNQIRHHRRRKRGGGAAAGEDVDRLTARRPLPDEFAALGDMLATLLRPLDEETRWIVRHKMQGHTNVEIAVRLGRSVPTVERRMRLVRRRWLNDDVT